MNKKQILIIFGIILIISIFVFYHYMTVRNFELENTPKQLKAIIGNCGCQLNEDLTHKCKQSFIDWQNSTHYIDNNLCEYITLEEHSKRK